METLTKAGIETTNTFLIARKTDKLGKPLYVLNRQVIRHLDRAFPIEPTYSWMELHSYNMGKPIWAGCRYNAFNLRTNILIDS